MLTETASSSICDCAQLGNEPFELKLLVLSLFLFCWTHYFKKKIQINKLFRQTLQIGLFILKSIWHVVGFSVNLIRREARFQAGSFRLRFLLEVSLENILRKYDSAINSGKMKLRSIFQLTVTLLVYVCMTLDNKTQYPANLDHIY